MTGRTEKIDWYGFGSRQKVLPNGNLFIEGHRIILVNNEEQHFYISGIIRPIDIDQNNIISSSKVAEAEIEFVGRGIMTENQQQGWFSRYFGWIFPLLIMRILTMNRFIIATTLSLALFLPSLGSAAPSRIKELADVRGVRENMLIGYGLVVGLSSTGDSQQVLFTTQSISGMLGRLGVRVSPQDIRSRNVAAVMVTAKSPAFVRSGAHIDVNVGSMGDARSLAGGTLLMTPLKGPDGQVYALGQGSVQAGGFAAGTQNGASVQKNQPTSGRIPGAVLWNDPCFPT